MKIRSIRHHLNQGTKNVFKSGLTSFASIAAVATCSFILILSLCLAINLDYFLEDLEKSLGISIYLADTVSTEECEELYAMLQEIPHISEIDFIGKQDAFNIAKDNWGEVNGILAGFEEDNPFPRSFELTVSDIKYQQEVIKNINIIRDNFEKNLVEKRIKEEKLLKSIIESQVVSEIIESYSNEVQEGEDIDVTDQLEITTGEEEITHEIPIDNSVYEYVGIESIKNSQEYADILSSLNRTIRIVSIVIILILAVIAVAIIINTIKLTVYIRKNEINIMKYVGATDWFIRWPFVIEGVIIGLLGSLLSIIVSIFFYSELKMILIRGTLSLELRNTFEMFLVIAPVTLLLGSLLGTIGSVSSIKRYLNV